MKFGSVKITYVVGWLQNEQEVREGSFIHLCDPCLTQETGQVNSPQLYGQVHHFIGFSPSHVAALINILTFYRFGHLVSYNTSKVIYPGLCLGEQTIILLACSRCHLEKEPHLEFKPEDVEMEYTHIFFRSQGLAVWGPKRDWPNRADWERELRMVREERDRESRKRAWGRKEAVKRGQEGASNRA